MQKSGRGTGTGGEGPRDGVPQLGYTVLTPREDLTVAQQVQMYRDDRPREGRTPGASLGQRGGGKLAGDAGGSAGNLIVCPGGEDPSLEGKLDRAAAPGLDLRLSHRGILLRGRRKGRGGFFGGSDHPPADAHRNRVGTGDDEPVAAHIRQPDRLLVVTRELAGAR